MATNSLTIYKKNSLAAIKQALDADPKLPSHNTQRQYLANLRDFEDYRKGKPFTKLMVEEYAAKLQKAGKAPNTINQKLAAVRWYARKLADLAADQDDPNAQVIGQKAERVASVKGVRGERPPRGRHLAAGELAALMLACENDHTPAGRRDAALFALAWATGIRRASLADLTVADLKITSESEADLIVHGKGNKVIDAYVYNGAFMLLADWLAIRGQAAGPLFVTIGKGHRITGGRLSGEALRKILAKRADQAGLSDTITWHDFRRTFAGNLLDAGKDLATVQKLMGHKSSDTTSKYDRRPENARREAVKALFVPYHKVS